MNETNFLAFCAQFNEFSGRKPTIGAFCGHEWIFKKCSVQVVDYGSVMVYGTHGHWKCEWCGKERTKVYKGNKFKVHSRKEIENYYKTDIWVKPPKQMEFI